MKRLVPIVYLVIGMLAAFAQVRPGRVGNGVIKGQVRNEKGAPAAGVFVSASTVFKGPGSRPFNATTNTAQDGSYTISRVPPGTYRICVQLPADSLLHSCLWNTGPEATVAVSGSQTANAPAVVAKKGRLLEVKVNDAQGLLDASERSKEFTYVQPTVIGGPIGGLPMISSGRSRNGRDFALLIPADVPVNLLVRGRGVRVTDSRGAAVDVERGVQIPIQAVAAGAQAPALPPFVFTITGPAPAVGR